MKQIIKFSSVMMLAFFLNIPLFAYDFEVDGIYYIYDTHNQTACVTSGDKPYIGSIIIPSSVVIRGKTFEVTRIGDGAFYGCKDLTEISIPNSIREIDQYAFYGCNSLTRIVIPNSVKQINEWYAFSFLENLKTFVFEDGEEPLRNDYSSFDFTTPKNFYIGRSWYYTSHWNLITGVETLAIGPLVKKIDNSRIDTKHLKTVYSFSVNPDQVIVEFSSTAYVNAKLYVPIGTKDKYMSAYSWENFFMIEEMDVEKMWNGQGDPYDNSQEKNKCEKPTISYANGKLTFSSATPNAICQSTITDTDISSFSGNEVQLTATYTINVYATASGYENSDVTTATLCWIDSDPKIEGIENGIAQVRANAVLIQSHDGTLSITGVAEGADIVVYSASGQMVGSAKARGEHSTIATNLRRGDVAIVRIGDRSLKVVMQ